MNGPSKATTTTPVVKPSTEAKPSTSEVVKPSTPEVKDAPPPAKAEAAVEETESSEEPEGDIPSAIIDKVIFEQILELDDDDREFSFEMITAYIGQAEETFGRMEKALSSKDLLELSRLGHYLKGSSASIGIWRVERSCAKIQHYGQLRDEEAGVAITSADALERIEQMIGQAKKENAEAEAWLRKYYKPEFDAGET